MGFVVLTRRATVPSSENNLMRCHHSPSQSSNRILFQTTRLLRSAGAHFYAWDRQIAHHDRSLRDSQRRVMFMEGVIPTAELGYTSLILEWPSGWAIIASLLLLSLFRKCFR
jgi:hypothetical protein